MNKRSERSRELRTQLARFGDVNVLRSPPCLQPGQTWQCRTRNVAYGKSGWPSQQCIESSTLCRKHRR
jgi:hypothetical protein